MIKTVLPLSFIVATRFFGLFVVLPVLSLYAMNLDGANEILIGFLVGIYAIFQMIFQVPFGILSDRLGRKHALGAGLFIFIVGCVICAYASDIYTMLFGRAIQGCGAVGAVATALIADFTREEIRGRAMAIMGAMIGASFALSMVLSPLLSAKFGLSSLFELSGILTLICIFLLYAVVPKEIKIKSYEQKVPFLQLLKDKNLTLMNLTNFMQKMFMTMAFLAIPLVLVSQMNYPKDELYKVYLVAMIFGFIAMGFAGVMGEKRGFSKQILLIGIGFFILSYAIFALSETVFGFCFGVVIFFIGFNMHEPIMQSMASKFAKVSQKGSTLGIFNSAGYFGSFMGGAFGGFLLNKFGIHELAFVITIFGAIWFVLLLKLNNPSLLKNIYFSKNEKHNVKNLEGLKGILECYEMEDSLVVKFNEKIIQEDKIRLLLATFKD